jgi:hypothetical protein
VRSTVKSLDNPVQSVSSPFHFSPRTFSIAPGSRRAAARRYDVSASFAVKLADRVARTGSAEPARQGRPPGGGKLAPYLPALLEWVGAKPDITMPELAAKTERREGCDSASGLVVGGASEGRPVV